MRSSNGGRAPSPSIALTSSCTCVSRWRILEDELGALDDKAQGPNRATRSVSDKSLTKLMIIDSRPRRSPIEKLSFTAGKGTK